MTDQNHWKAKETLLQRIQRVGWSEDEHGCWNWNGFVEPRGYAKVMHGGSSHRVHRVMLTREAPQTPEKDQACHKCDNRRCINPAHLFWGSAAENSADMVQKGRSRLGMAKGSGKLSVDDKNAILARRNAGESYRKIAADFGVTAGAVHKAFRSAGAS